jgi:mannosyl-3-phosphoglycerate phosphatase
MPFSGLVGDTMKPPPMIIFTDLDGTLLDHHDYSFDAAMPALQAIRSRDVPLILATSKTLAEVRQINRALDNPKPAIVENGCALCFPLGQDYPFEISRHEQIDDYAVLRYPPSYAQIRQFIEQQRSSHRWRLRGFGDMSATAVAESTGLGEHAAEYAKRRLCSEPFLWDDSEENLKKFMAAADAAGLGVTQGGRFWHLMGRSSKAQAIETMRNLYAADNQRSLTVIALGDSENDRGMLQRADIAVVIKRHDGTHLDCHGLKQTLLTQQPGPAGWNAAILEILTEPGSVNPSIQGD